MKWLYHWGSHIPVLLKALEVTGGRILELGMGIYSTPLLHWWCLSHDRELTSCENNPSYYSAFKREAGKAHKIFLLNNLEDIHLDWSWGLAFIDSNPMEQRARMAARLANKARILVLHDTEPEVEEYYGYQEIYPLFKYRFDYVRFKPFTTVLSNFEELGMFQGI